MPFVKSLRDVRIATLSGHVVNVPANVPTFLVAQAVADATARGCVQCDQHGKIMVPGVPDAAEMIEVDAIPFLSVEDREDPAKRKTVITKAVAKVFKKNDRSEFGNNGCPKAAVITRLVGFQVNGAEVAAVVEALSAAGD